MNRIILLAACLMLGGCARQGSESREDAPKESKGRLPAAGAAVHFVDATAEAGIRFIHFNDASERRYLPETMGSGAAFFDYDENGLPDLFLVNGASLSGSREQSPTCALYRNIDGRRFEDVTRPAGLAEPVYGMGAAVGDYDNDGHTDLLVTAVDGDRLYRNRGDGRFENVTTRMGLNQPGFSSSAAFVDYDRDGFLDLFIGRYVRWSRQGDIPCSLDGSHRIYCTPEVYSGDTNLLYRNLSGRGFEDVTRSSGIYDPEGKTLGIAILDHNRDGWPDLAVANDTVRNFLFINNRNGTFSETGVTSGMAYSESGATRGGMGIDTGDVDGDGRCDIVIGNFSQEMSALYRSSEKGYFVDDAAQAGIGIPTLMTLAFGSLLLDVDNDGWLDCVIANGHIEPDIAKFHPNQSYTQPLQFFRNERQGRFTLLGSENGGIFDRPMVARGMAAADFDGDGDLDLVVTQNGKDALLLRNEMPPQPWLRLRLVGRASNRSGYGASVRAVAGERTWIRNLVSGRSYLSACEPVVTLGFGDITRVDRLEITWPSGRLQTIESPPLNQMLVVEEPELRK
jgi:hypothetical protein